MFGPNATKERIYETKKDTFCASVFFLLSFLLRLFNSCSGTYVFYPSGVYNYYFWDLFFDGLSLMMYSEESQEFKSGLQGSSQGHHNTRTVNHTNSHLQLESRRKQQAKL